MNLDDILDNIDQYADNIDDLVRNLKQLGINSFDEFKVAIRESGISVNKSIRDQVATKFANSEEDDWNEAKQINTEESFQKYLNSYPEGKYRSSARDKIDELQKDAANSASDSVWNAVDKSDIKEIQSFVDTYPQSHHITEASKILRDLRKQQYLGVDIKALAKQIKAIRTDTRI